MQLPYASEPVRTSFDRWLEETVSRHRRELTFTEIRKGVQALSSLYVERRDEGGLAPRAVEGRGKRAALACYYAPLHFLTVHHAIRMVGDELPAPDRIVDLGCGTGAVGAAAGLPGRARRSELPRGIPAPAAGDLWCCGWFLSELLPADREYVLGRLRGGVGRGARVLLLEPLSTRVSPWWQEWCDALEPAGVRSELVRVSIHRPRFIAEMDKAARLDHQVIGGRVLIGPQARPAGV